MTYPDAVGWAATAVIVTSYTFRNPIMLRRVQAVSALLWMTYGFLIHSGPVIVANIIVFGAAALSSIMASRRKPAVEVESSSGAKAPAS